MKPTNVKKWLVRRRRILAKPQAFHPAICFGMTRLIGTFEKLRNLTGAKQSAIFICGLISPQLEEMGNGSGLR
jgi:hypothetical protein